MKSLNQLLTAIFMVIGLGFVGFQLFISGNAMSAMSELAADQASFARDSRERDAESITLDTPQEKELVILKEAGRRTPRAEVTALVNQTHFDRERYINVGIIVDPRDLMKEGETLPEDEELQELWMKVRSRHYSDAACAVLVERFADACRPHGEESKKVREHPLFAVTLRLDYTPATPLGALPETPSVVYEDFDLRSDLGGTYSSEPGLDADWLRDVLAKVEAGCETIRQVHGNCGPLRIDIGTRGTELRGLPLGRFEVQLSTSLRAELGFLTAPAEVAGAAQ